MQPSNLIIACLLRFLWLVHLPIILFFCLVFRKGVHAPALSLVENCEFPTCIQISPNTNTCLMIKFKAKTNFVDRGAVDPTR